MTSDVPYIYKVKDRRLYNVLLRDKDTTLLSIYVPTIHEAKVALVDYISNNVDVVYNQLLVTKLNRTTFSNSRQYINLIKFCDLFDELDVEIPDKLLNLRDSYNTLVEVFEKLNKE